MLIPARIRRSLGRIRRWWRLRTAPSFDRFSPEGAFRVAYQVLLGREPDIVGTQSNLPRLRSGELSRTDLVDAIRGSEEFQAHVRFRSLSPSLHASRCLFIRSLPKGARILDLGGTHQASAEGAMVRMGYPYPFEELVVIDLPSEDRHPIYRQGSYNGEVATRLGPVRYEERSMADLSCFDDATFDLVYSGQSIEHVPVEVADTVLAEAFRVLRPGGWLALDTPNARATRLQQDAFVDADHEYEYLSHEIEAKLTMAGFEIVERVGLNWLGASLASGKFDEADAAGNHGVFAEIDDCYLLAYVCQKPK